MSSSASPQPTAKPAIGKAPGSMFAGTPLDYAAHHPAPAGDAVHLCGPHVIASSQLQYRTSTSSGPGGQNVNKRQTRVELRLSLAALAGLGHDALERLRRLASHCITDQGELVIVQQQTRSQAQNRAAALDQLRAFVREALIRPRRRLATRPSRSSVERRLTAKHHQAQRKQQRRADD